MILVLQTTREAGRIGSCVVIVVDDVPNSASVYASLIERETGLLTCSAQTAEEAMDLITSNPIRVAVLDQILDGNAPARGTDLLVQLRTIEPTLVGIMLTGQAGIQDTARAMDLQYKAIIDKGDISQLPEAVRKAYHERVANDSSMSSRSLLLSERRSFGMHWQPEVTLLNIRIIDEDFVSDEGWKTYKQVHAGQSISEEIKLKVTYEVRLVNESTTRASLSLGGRVLSHLLPNLEASVNELTSSHETTFTAFEKAVVISDHLDQPSNPDEPHITHRNHQYASVFRRVRAILMLTCRECAGSTERVILLTATKPRFATRVQEWRSDSKEIVVRSTGFVDAD